MKFFSYGMLFFIAGCFPALAQTAPVHVQNAWVRATVSPQQATGAFFTLTTKQSARLVAVHTPVAKMAELHQVTMSNHRMNMQAVNAIDLPAGKTIMLQPGGYHVMLMDLPRAIKTGDQIPLTLVLEYADRSRQEITIKAQARPLNYMPAANR